MFWVLWIAGALVGLLALFVVVLYLLGRNIPEEHTASSIISLTVPPADVFNVIDDVARHAEWAKGVTKVEMLPDKSGLQQCRMRMGRNAFVLVRTRRDASRLIERTISDDHGPFSGTWTHSFVPAIVNGKEGCQVKLTEVGRVKSAIPRAVMKHMMGYHIYIDQHLVSLGRKFGQDVEPRKA